MAVSAGQHLEWTLLEEGRVRILYFSEGYTTHDRRFLQGLAAAGHEVHFLRLDTPGRALDQRSLPQGVISVDAPAGWAGDSREAFLSEALSKPLGAMLGRIQPDAVMAGPIPTCAAAVAGTGFHPWIAVSWGSDLLLEAEQDSRVRER